jgi:hypothetical protein
MMLLHNIFRDRTISKDIRPPPDLAPPDYYLWGAMKGTI